MSRQVVALRDLDLTRFFLGPTVQAWHTTFTFKRHKISAFRHATSRARPGMFLDSLKADVPFENHRRGNRGVRAACRVCASLQNAAKKRALERAANDAANDAAEGDAAKKSLSQTAWGCITCNVAICQSPLCWDMFHNSKIGVR